jgi:hypothetical protein
MCLNLLRRLPKSSVKIVAVAVDIGTEHFLKTSSERYANLLGDHLFSVAASVCRYTPVIYSRE